MRIKEILAGCSICGRTHLVTGDVDITTVHCIDCEPESFDDIDWSHMSDPGENDPRTISITLANKHLKYIVGYVRKAAEDSFDGDVYRTLHALATQLELVI